MKIRPITDWTSARVFAEHPNDEPTSSCSEAYQRLRMYPQIGQKVLTEICKNMKLAEGFQKQVEQHKKRWQSPDPTLCHRSMHLNTPLIWKGAVADLRTHSGAVERGQASARAFALGAAASSVMLGTPLHRVPLVAATMAGLQALRLRVLENNLKCERERLVDQEAWACGYIQWQADPSADPILKRKSHEVANQQFDGGFSTNSCPGNKQLAIVPDWTESVPKHRKRFSDSNMTLRVPFMNVYKYLRGCEQIGKEQIVKICDNVRAHCTPDFLSLAEQEKPFWSSRKSRRSNIFPEPHKELQAYYRCWSTNAAVRQSALNRDTAQFTAYATQALMSLVMLGGRAHVVPLAALAMASIAWKSQAESQARVVEAQDTKSLWEARAFAYCLWQADERPSASLKPSAQRLSRAAARRLDGWPRM